MSAFDTPGAGAGAAPVIDTSNLATQTQLASAVAAIIAAIPPAAAGGGGGGAVVGEVKNIALDANGQLPDGYAMVNGQQSVAQAGLRFSFTKSAGAPGIGGLLAAGGFTSNLVQTPDGKVHNLIGLTQATNNHTVTDLAAGTQSYAANYPNPYNCNATLCVLASGRLFAFGGSYYGSAFDAAYVLSQGAFTAVAPMPAPRDATSAVLLPNGKVLVIGGGTTPNTSGQSFTAASLFSRCDTYDENTNTWAQVAPAPVRGAGPAVLLPTGDVLWMPLNTSDGTTLSTSTGRAFLYAYLTNTWRETDTLPVSTAYDYRAGLLPDDVGALILNAQGTSKAWRYNTGNAAGNHWTAVDYLFFQLTACPTRGCTGLRLSDGRYLMGCTAISDASVIVDVQYNAGNTIVAARKT